MPHLLILIFCYTQMILNYLIKLFNFKPGKYVALDFSFGINPICLYACATSSEQK